MITSLGEETFWFQLKAHRLPLPVREYQFSETRRWRADFAWPKERILVEIEGGSWSGGRHVRGEGFERDCRKYSDATLNNWRVFRFTTKMVQTGEAIETLRQALDAD